MQMALSGTLVSSATLLESPLASIVLLNSTEISIFDEGCSCSCCFVSSLKQMHIFVARDKTVLDVSSFLLAIKNYYYAKGCRYFEVEVP
jgi:hypothetical protein